MKVSYLSFLILFDLIKNTHALLSTSGTNVGSSSSFVASRTGTCSSSLYRRSIGSDKSPSVMRPTGNKSWIRCHRNLIPPLQALPAAAAAVAAPLGSLSVLAFIILVHEAGHFLAARSFGIKVKEFSVGVGPKVFGFVQGDDRDENEGGIEFNLRAIPFGGYVRFPENYNATLEYQLEQEAEDKRKQIEEKVKEIRESEGGGVSDGLLSMIGNVLNVQKSTEEERIRALQMIARELKEQQGQDVTEMMVPWWKKLFAGVKNNDEKEKQEDKGKRSIVIEQDGTITVPPVDYYNDPDLLQNRPWVQRGIVLVGGVVFNIILAFLLYFGELTIGSGLQKPVFGQGAIVNSVPRVNSASVGLLDRGDVILALNGELYYLIVLCT